MNFLNIFGKTKKFFSNIDFLKNTAIFRGEDGDDDDDSPPPPPPPCPPCPPMPPPPPCPPCDNMSGGTMSNQVLAVSKEELLNLAKEGVELELPIINLDDLPEDSDFYLAAPGDDPTAASAINLCPAPPACVRVGGGGGFPYGNQGGNVCLTGNIDVPIDMPGQSKVCLNVNTTF